MLLIREGDEPELTRGRMVSQGSGDLKQAGKTASVVVRAGREKVSVIVCSDDHLTGIGSRCGSPGFEIRIGASQHAVLLPGHLPSQVSEPTLKPAGGFAEVRMIQEAPRADPNGKCLDVMTKP